MAELQNPHRNLTEIQILKKQQRQLCLQARQSLSVSERAEKSTEIVRKLMLLPEIQNAHVIFSYLSTPDEVCLDAFHEEMRRIGKRVAFPVSHQGGTMDARMPLTAEAIRRGLYDIREPDEAESELITPEEIDVVLVPCVGFDRGLRRLGHGAGYYDRYLSLCPKAVRICVAFDAQELPEIAVEKTDFPMTVLLTESLILK